MRSEIELPSVAGPENLTVSNCSIHLFDPKSIGSLIPLGLICLIVTFGNILVISAVRISSKLRGATNLLIVSLAVADLLLGVLVLPMSAVYEVLDVWILGSNLCFIWLSVDVLTSTASILHLVVISLDRYIAVTHPVTYPNIMTTNRAKLMVCGVWVISFIICFPPLVGWNSRGETSSGYVDLGNCTQQCTISSDPGYVIYSAVGSFYAPMLVMIFLNWRIYRTAKKTSKAIRQGFTRVKNGGADIGGLGIHRGKSVRDPEKLDQNYIELSNFSSLNRRDSPGNREKKMRQLQNNDDRQCHRVVSKFFEQKTEKKKKKMNGNISISIKSMKTCSHMRQSFSDQGTQTTKSYFIKKTRKKRVDGDKKKLYTFKNLSPGSQPEATVCIERVYRSESAPPSPLNRCAAEDNKLGGGGGGGVGAGAGAGGVRGSSKTFARRNIKNQVRKFKMETKAAKTIGIIVGCFVVCWLPFFSIYISRVFCADCVPSLLFSIFFWLGYCNSAINPFIYALFARDFRNAFKKILCRIFCKRIS